MFSLQDLFRTCFIRRFCRDKQPIWVLLTCLLSASGAIAADGGPLSTAEPATYSTPLTISKGGTYKGNWRSTSDTIPAVKITTTEPVIIEYSHISSTGTLIQAAIQGNLTVRHTSFHGKKPNSNTRFRGNGIAASTYKNLVVENNFFENTGIVVGTDEYSGDGTPQNNLIVRYNQVRNINGRSTNGGRKIVQFVAVQNYRQPSGNPRNAEIAWNEVINLPNVSFSEDLINFYKGGGRADGWFKVHDNYLQGSYPYNPATSDSSGSGMIIDGPDNDRAAYVEAYNNIVINTTNAGMNVAAGSHIWYHHNRIISTGKLPDGTWMRASYGGVGIFNFYAGDAEYTGVMQDIIVENNVVGWAKENYNNPYSKRNDNPVEANYGGAYKASNIPLPDAPITQAMQDQEYQTFLQRVQNGSILLGPRATNTPPTITAIAGKTINQNASTGPIAFTIGDTQTAAASLTLTSASSNPTLVPNANIVFGGSGANRTVTVNPAADLFGNTVITLTVSDGFASTSTTFSLTVNDPAFVYLSDLDWVGTPVNGWGSPEKDRSNGEQAPADGKAISLRGTTYAKGIGVHAVSELVYSLNGNYARFTSTIGVDDEVDGSGTVAFQVWADGVKLFDSGNLNGSSAVQAVDVNLTGKTQLRLVVTDGGDGTSSDHADWANARLARTPFYLWQLGQFGNAAADPVISAPTADPNFNGYANLAEYFLGLDPLSSTTRESLPYVQSENGSLTLTYRRDASASDVTGSAERSSDLLNWSNSGVTDSLISDGPIQVRRASILMDGSHQFLRLKIIK